MNSPVALPGPIWLVGCGNMAGAMLDGWILAGADPRAVTIIRPSGRAAVAGVRVVTAIPDEPAPPLVLIGVKPQKLDEVASSLAGMIGPETSILSILAGVECASLRDRFPGARSIVRTMPNLPVQIGNGVTGLFATEATPADRDAADRLMRALGAAEWVDEEALLDVIAALGGSSPAFLYRFAGALARASEALGLSRDQADRMAVLTVRGAVELAARSGESMSALADRVASPGGSTRKGLDVLDREQRLERLMRETLDAAVRRNREMAAEARRRSD